MDLSELEKFNTWWKIGGSGLYSIMETRKTMDVDTPFDGNINSSSKIKKKILESI